MRTTALFSGSALIRWARSRRTAGATWATRPGPLKNWLAANHALRTLSRTTLTLHGPCTWGSLHWSALWHAGRSHTRRRRRIYGARTGLRGNHPSRLHNRLARHGLGRRRSGSSLRACCCHWRRSGRLRLRGWRRNNYCRRMCGRGDHNCGRSGRLFNWRRRNHCRRHWLNHRRCNHNTSFRCRSSRFGYRSGWLFCRGRRRCWRRFHGSRRSSGWGASGGRFDRRCRRMLLLLLSLSEQPCYVARLGNLGEVNLRFHLCSGRSFPRRRTGPGRKMLSYPYRFILLNRA
jgi:hypothetical protein